MIKVNVWLEIENSKTIIYQGDNDDTLRTQVTNFYIDGPVSN